MRISYNGDPLEVPGGTLAELLRERGAPATGTAVAVNGEVVPRASLRTRAIAEGDTVDVVTAVQGG
jgi:sulfur carrier protein